MKTKHLIQLRKGDRFIAKGGVTLEVTSNPEIRDGMIRFDVVGELGVPTSYRADTNWKVEMADEQPLSAGL